MTVTNKNATKGFRKKVYTRMYNSSISALKADCEKPRKKITPTSKINGLREQFKKTFLPLLIDVFELRQTIRNHKTSKKNPFLFSFGKPTTSPLEILERLMQLQNDIEESKRWHEGVIKQISKGIEEAKEALQFIEHSPDNNETLKKYQIDVNNLLKSEKTKGFWRRLFKK